MEHTSTTITNPSKEKPAISILIPCYNVEKYLKECLDSIISQTMTDLEIICLNDGSKDNTLNIINEYAKQDERIIVVDKANSGYGATMNIGLNMARGKYIGIVESDDFIEKDMFRKMYDAAEKYNLDVTRCLYREINEITGVRTDINFKTAESYECNVVFNPREQKKIFFITPAIWSNLYRRDFLNENNIRFLETPGASYQDTSFAFKVYAMAKKMMVIREYLHNYRINEGSSVSAPGKVFCVCDEEAEIRRYAKEHGLFDELKQIMAFRAFHSYRWNYERLSKPLKRQFIKRWSEEAKQNFAEGAISRKYFSKSRAFRLWLIAHYPWVYHFANKI